MTASHAFLLVSLVLFVAPAAAQSSRPPINIDIATIIKAILGNAILDGRYQNATQCRRDIWDYIGGVTQFKDWAIKMFDATGKLESGLFLGNTISLGSYTACTDHIVGTRPTNDTFGAQYCVITIKLDTSNDNNPIVQEINKSLPKSYQVFLKLIWGYCVPDSCEQWELLEIASDLLRQLLTVIELGNILGNSETESAIKYLLQMFRIQEPICQDLEKKAEPLTIAAFVFAACVIVLAILATAYDLCVQYKNEMKSDDDYVKSDAYFEMGASSQSIGARPQKPTINYAEEDSSDSDADSEESCCHKTVTSLSCNSNGPRIYNLIEPAGNIACLHGLRVVSFLILLNAQNYFQAMDFAGWLLWQQEWQLSRLVSMTSLNSSLATDTFLTISGCLVLYHSLEALRKCGGPTKLKFWLSFYLHRYIRLTPLYAAIMFTYLGMAAYVYYGPQWNQKVPAEPNCATNWWTNLLYVNNLVNSTNMCMGHTWYMAIDMQLYWVSPIAIVAWYYKAWLGFLVALSWVVIHVVTSYSISVTNGYTMDIFENYLPPKNPESGYVNAFTDIFIKPWCRCGAYALGMMAGYIVLYMRRHPAATRKFLRKHRRGALLFSIAMWLVALFLLPFVMFINYDDARRVDIWTAEEAAAYRAGSRIAWSFSIAWIIVACEAGYGWWPAKFLSSRFWLAPARLTYGAYLLHAIIVPFLYWHSEKPIMLSDLNSYYTFMGNVGLSYIIATIYSLLIEYPFLRFDRLFRRWLKDPTLKKDRIGIVHAEIVARNKARNTLLAASPALQDLPAVRQQSTYEQTYAHADADVTRKSVGMNSDAPEVYSTRATEASIKPADSVVKTELPANQQTTQKARLAEQYSISPVESSF